MSDKKSNFKKGGKPFRNTNKTPSGSSNPQNKSGQKKKKALEDYYFYVGSSKQASDYEVTADYIINHIKLTFEYGNDIAEALRNLELEDTNLWKPKLVQSKEADAATAAVENKQLDMEWQNEYKDFSKRRTLYTTNQPKAYSLLWERCAKAMQNKLSSRTDFEPSLYNNPINTLKAIKEHSLNYQETRYEMSIIADAFRATFSTKQKEGESLQDYTRRFKTARDILESHVGGPVRLTKFVKNLPKYK